MLELLDQIDAANASGLHYLALMGALAVPDICAALAAKNGRTDGTKYRQWVRDHIAEADRQGLSPSDLYRFRCSMLHQGSGHHHGDELERVIFVEPGNGPKVSSTKMINVGGESTHVIDLVDFCTSITSAERSWLAAHAASPRVMANLVRFIRRHPNGIPPFIVGTPVVG
ncbi:MAG TPA: hypothetical protein VM345_00015 [Acidimicrobiales bacterium]|jgi:hypothetical protein|nr:hypothetical protein [Acidimicrobiales bacterium]